MIQGLRLRIMLLKNIHIWILILILTRKPCYGQYRRGEWEALTEPTKVSNKRIQSWKIMSWPSNNTKSFHYIDKEGDVMSSSPSSNDKSFWTRFIGSDLSHTYVSNQTAFPYYDTLLASRYPQFKPEYQTINISRLEAIDILSHNSKEHQKSAIPSSQMYFSGNIRLPAFKSVVDAIDLLDVVDEELFDRVTVLTWLGTPKASASPHYDSVNNIYIQLYGMKTFNLLPPRSIISNDLMVYGRNHPYACQSRLSHLYCSETCEWFQRDFRTVSWPYPGAQHDLSSNLSVSKPSEDTLHQRNSSVIRITLRPGDILYIPAFWYHEVSFTPHPMISDTISCQL